MTDELTEVERVESSHFYYSHAANEVIDELFRLRAVEQAATALVEHWEAIRNPADKLVWTIAEQLTERLAAAVHGETP